MTIDSNTLNTSNATVTPYGTAGMGKKQEVALMFDNISGRYDFLNHLLSMGIDKGWRKKAISLLKENPPAHLLDIATGTGDFAIAALKIHPGKITGIDISNGMLESGRKKIQEMHYTDKIELLYGDAENISFPDNTFDAAIVAFGVRNFEDLDMGLKQIARVLKPGSKFIILEFSNPQSFPIKQLYTLYFRYILPVVGRLVSKDQAAYSYLPQSVKAFPDGERFLDRMSKAGFIQNKQKELTFGIASIYSGTKK
jgi:demethylmenaquinone methyltransferase/2-methoxy-6-polyprenyl-1,4-benzoquinol methylase